MKPSLEEKFRLFKEKSAVSKKPKIKKCLSRKTPGQNKSPHHDKLLSLGLKPGTKEWDRARKRINSEEKRKRGMSEEERNAFRERKRKYYAANIERIREANTRSKRKQIAERRDEINSAARERYKDDPEEVGKQRNRRHKREPYRLIRAAQRDLVSGVLTGDEAIERISRAIAWADEAIAKKSGIRSKKG